MKPERILSLLLAGISLLGLLPLLPFVDRPLLIIALLALPLGIGLRQRRQFLPNLPATLVTLGGTLFYLAQWTLADPVRPLVHALVLLLCLRQLTDPSPRHLLQGFVLSLVLLSGSSLLTLSPWFLLLLVLQITAISLALVLLTFYARDADLQLTTKQSRSLWRTALWLPLGSLLLMVFFFFILPRTQTPLWDLFNPAGKAQTGYSDEVRPGAAGAVDETTNVVLRAEMKSIAPEDLYWRGAVLDRFDGQVWRRPKRLRPPERVVGGQMLEVQVLQRPGRAPVLFTLDRPGQWLQGRKRSLGGQIFAAVRPGSKQIAFRLQSRIDGRLLPDPRGIPQALSLPSPLPALLVDLAGQLGQGSAQQRIDRTLDWYREQGFRYTTQELPTGEDALEQFLFDRKAGHCEFFASSLAVLLRLQGVPARLVGGYFGGEYNAFGGYYLVREAMAHVWVEALVPEEGWVRLDASSLAVNADSGIAGRRGNQLPWHQRLADGIQYIWTRSVVSYDLQQQVATARQLRQQMTGFRSWLWPLAGLGGVVLMLFWLRSWKMRRTGQTASRERQLWLALLKRLDLTETDLSPAKGLHHLSESNPDPSVHHFLTLYQQALFDQKGLTDTRYDRLHLLLKKISKP